MSQKKNILYNLIPWIVIAATFYFFGQAIISNWEVVSDIDYRVDSLVLAATLMFTLAVPISGILWGGILQKISNQKVRRVDAIRIHSASWLLKYIPGQAGSLINKLAWGVKNGFSKKSITTSFMYENILMVFAGALLSIPVLSIFFATEAVTNLSLFIPLLLIIPMLIAFENRLFLRMLNYPLTKLGRKPIPEEYFLSKKALLEYLFGFFVPRIFNGLGFVFVAISLFGATSDMFLGLAAIYILAGIVGLLAIFVPSGLGVREAVIVLFASQYFSVEEAVVLSVVARFYATIADTGVLLVYIGLNKGKIRQQ